MATRRSTVYEVKLYEQSQQGVDDEAVLSPEEKIEGRPSAPAPGVERFGDNEVKREINPNTE